MDDSLVPPFILKYLGGILPSGGEEGYYAPGPAPLARLTRSSELSIHLEVMENRRSPLPSPQPAATPAVRRTVRARRTLPAAEIDRMLWDSDDEGPDIDVEDSGSEYSGRTASEVSENDGRDEEEAATADPRTPGSPPRQRRRVNETLWEWEEMNDERGFIPNIPVFNRDNSGISDEFPVTDESCEMDYFTAFFDEGLMTHIA